MNYVSFELALELWKIGIVFPTEKRYISGTNELMCRRLLEASCEMGEIEIGVEDNVIPEEGIDIINKIKNANTFNSWWERSIPAPSLAELINETPVSIILNGKKSILISARFDDSDKHHYIYCWKYGRSGYDICIGHYDRSDSDTNPCNSLAKLLIVLESKGLYQAKLKPHSTIE